MSTTPTSHAHSDAASTTTEAGTADIVTGNHYDKYSGGNVAIRFLTQRFLGALDDLLDAAAEAGPITRILEVGCGEGEIAERLRDRFPDASVTALDLPDPDLRTEWDGRPGVEFLEGDAHDLQFEDNSFDLVVAVEVCEHLTDPWTGLAEMARVSSRHLVLTVPREPLFRLGNFLTGRHVGSFGNTPGHFNHWGTPGFLRFVSVQAAVANVRLPFPWTAVHARVDA